MEKSEVLLRVIRAPTSNRVHEAQPPRLTEVAALTVPAEAMAPGILQDRTRRERMLMADGRPAQAPAAPAHRVRAAPGRRLSRPALVCE